MIDECLVHMQSGRVRFRVPLHTEVPMTDNRLYNAVFGRRCDIEASRQPLDSLVMARCHRVRAAHTKKRPSERHGVLGHVMSDVFRYGSRDVLNETTPVVNVQAL